MTLCTLDSMKKDRSILAWHCGVDLSMIYRPLRVLTQLQSVTFVMSTRLHYVYRCHVMLTTGQSFCYFDLLNNNITSTNGNRWLLGRME